MIYIGTLLTLFIPGLAAAGLHARIFRERATAGKLAYRTLLYTFAIAVLLGAVKLARGKGEIWVADSFNSISNLVKYGCFGAALAAVLPLCWRAFWLVFRRAARGLSRRKNAVLTSLLGGLLDLDEPAQQEKQPAREIAPPKKPEATITQPAKAAPAAHPADEALRVKKSEESLAAQEAEMTATVEKVVPRRKSQGGPQRMLYNIGVRDEMNAPKSAKRRAAQVAVYAFIYLLVMAIIFAVFTS